MKWTSVQQVLELSPLSPLPQDPADELEFRDRGRAIMARSLRAVAWLLLALGLLAWVADRFSPARATDVARVLDHVRVGHALVALAALAALAWPFFARRPLLVGVGMAVGSCAASAVLFHAPGRLESPASHLGHGIAAAMPLLVVAVPWQLHFALFLPVMRLEMRVREQIKHLRMLAAHLERAREDERARIARELHDELGQELTAMRYALTYLKQRYEREPGNIRANLDELESLLSRTAKTTRHLVSELRPRILDDLGLDAGVEWLLQRTRERANLACELTMSCGTLDLDVDVSIAAFRILQESLTNVVRHARATRVGVEVSARGDVLWLVVRDDGVGMADPRAAPGHGGMGLLGMRERAAALGGALSIESAPGAGTTVRVSLPVRGQRASQGGAA